MKWSERSIFYKAVLLTQILCSLVYIIAVVCYFCGVLPSLYGAPWAQVCFGTVWLCIGIDNLKISRTNAIISFITAALAYLTAILGWVR